MKHKSHCEHFWDQLQPDLTLYEKVEAMIRLAEEHNEQDALWTLLVGTLSRLSPGEQNEVLCALADSEAQIPEQLQFVIITLLHAPDKRVAMGAASCLLACAGNLGRYHIMVALAAYNLPQKALVRGILNLHPQTGEHEE